MQRSASNAQSVADQGEPESVVVHVQLRPRRGATKKCLAALAALAAFAPAATDADESGSAAAPESHADPAAAGRPGHGQVSEGSAG